MAILLSHLESWLAAAHIKINIVRASHCVLTPFYWLICPCQTSYWPDPGTRQLRLGQLNKKCGHSASTQTPLLLHLPFISLRFRDTMDNERLLPSKTHDNGDQALLTHIKHQQSFSKRWLTVPSYNVSLAFLNCLLLVSLVTGIFRSVGNDAPLSPCKWRKHHTVLMSCLVYNSPCERDHRVSPNNFRQIWSSERESFFATSRARARQCVAYFAGRNEHSDIIRLAGPIRS
jgi:hypothetical protein